MYFINGAVSAFRAIIVYVRCTSVLGTSFNKINIKWNPDIEMKL